MLSLTKASATKSCRNHPGQPCRRYPTRCSKTEETHLSLFATKRSSSLWQSTLAKTKPFN